jgi:anti-sigma-K factor RskA
VSAVRGSRGGDHEIYDELAVGWALHALEPEDEALVGLHLPDCARCARTVTETAEVMAALAADLPPAEPSEDLRERIRSAVDDVEQVRRPVLPFVPPVASLEEGIAPRPAAGEPVGRPPTAAARWSSGIRRGGLRARMPQALVAAGAAVVIGLGVWNVVLSTSRQQAEGTAAEEQHVVHALLTPGQATIAALSDSARRRVATVVARHGRIQLVTSGLEVDDQASTTYVLWGTRKGPPTSLGTFDVIRPGLDLHTVGADHTGLDGFSGYAISLERGRTAPARPTHIVANGQVTP